MRGRQKAELDNQGLSCPGIVQIPQLPRTSAIETSDVGELESDRVKYKKSISETTSGEDPRLGDTNHCFLRISHFTDTEPVTVFQMS